MDSFHLVLTILFAALYGATMKIADLFNEHGMKPWFPGSGLIFGILWGVFGSLLILVDRQVATTLLAMILAFIIRMRIDYRNHALATVLMIITFSLKYTLDIVAFSIFFPIFLIFGTIKDYVDDVLKLKGSLYLITESAWHYVIPPYIYSLYTNNWWVFSICTVYILSYDLAKIVLRGKYKA
jgi:hypothetical protein